MIRKRFCKRLVPLLVITHALDATGKGAKLGGMEFKAPSSVIFVPVPWGHGTGSPAPLRGVGEAVAGTGSAFCHFHLCHRVGVLSGKNPLKSLSGYCRLNKGTKSILLEGLGSEMEHNHLAIILGIVVIFSRCILL